MKKLILALSFTSAFTQLPAFADDFVPAEVINKNYDQLTNTSPRASRLEGINLSSYLVDENGQVSDIEIVATAGQKKYQREVMDYVSKLNYKSAKLNGETIPVAKTITVSSQNLHAGFSNDKASRGFFNDYEQASKLIDEKKYDEAKSRINELENEHTKNTVEIVLLAWLKSQHSYFVQDWKSFDQHINEAFLFRGNLPDQIQKRVIKNALQWFISKQDYVRAYDAIDALGNIESITFTQQNKEQLLAQVNDIYKSSGDIKQQIELLPKQAVLPLLSKSEVALEAQMPLTKVQLRCENKVVNYDISTIDKIVISQNDVRCGLLIKSAQAQTVTLKQSGDSFL
ncbi:energy transducer TonB [Pseudoalteromonas distincta]|uniref:Energy transducer TonB n=2 Tax=Pseudoalteromonas distincta TaxID=77608 RepID=A0A4P9J025_9GAMM|nr:energy transducer TonB [Pseudoalteromonas distincta]QCU74047.1 energy transducer TonB [Pseudoalteromonas distincta]